MSFSERQEPAPTLEEETAARLAYENLQLRQLFQSWLSWRHLGRAIGARPDPRSIDVILDAAQGILKWGPGL